jgi:hypothetical protein
MIRANGGPTCPKPERLRELIEVVGECSELKAKDEVDLIDALDWLATSLSNRSLYHKRQQIKTKIMKEKMVELGLGPEIDKLSKDATFNHVVDEMPTRQELTDFINNQKEEE